MAEPLRHRQTKEAATDMFSLQPTRHISTLHKATDHILIGAGRFRGEADMPRASGACRSGAFDVVDGARSRHRCAIGCFVGSESHEGAVQMQISTIGLDIAKNVFQVHGIDANETVVVRKRLRRSQVLAFFKALPPCLIGMEACATAHYWARELTKLRHRVRLMPAKDVKTYGKRNKNDEADADAICE